MEERERRPTKMLTASDELRQLVIENPGLPLLIFAGEEANQGDYYYMSCTSCSAEIGEFLDCMQEVNDERCYTDRDMFAEDLADNLYYHTENAETMDDEEWDKYVEARVAEYEPYWRKAIILYVDN